MQEPVIGKLAAGLASGRAQITGWLSLSEPSLAELFAREGCDAVTLDMQHGAYDFAGASRAIIAVAAAGKPSMVRIPVGEYSTASRLVDAGAAGIIAPMVNSAAEARRFVSFLKFPPLGERSWGPRATQPLSGLEGGAYLTGANALIQAIAMIETREALDALDEIVATPGVDGVFVGPSDLSIALSDGKKVDPHGPEVDAALERIVATTNAHGKYAGLFCFDGARVKAAGARGFAIATLGSDLILMRAVARAELAAAR